MHEMPRFTGLAGRLLPFLLLTAACATDAPSGVERAAYARAGEEPGAHRQYGPPLALGDGKVRAYVVLDGRSGQAPAELGVALDARALENLGTEPRVLMLELPQHAPAPYRFAMVDWNPAGHDPQGIYTFPHFDFHFYLVPAAEVEAIDPADPDFAAHANNLPGAGYRPPFYAVLAPPGAPPAAVAVPGMGVHWSDVRSPELHAMLGHPENYQQFTKTFIYGSWAGRFTFLEPMITLDYLQSVDDVVTTPLPVAPQVAVSGWYPAAYRITYDAQRREYRVALAELSWRAAR